MKQIKTTLKKLYRSAQFFNETERTDFIRLDGNESVDGLPEAFVREILSGITSNQLATYPNPRRCTEAVAKYLGVDREEVLLTNGSDAAIKMLFEVYVNEGDRVIIASPTFEMYEVYCRMYGAIPVTLSYGEGFVFPYGEYLDEIKKGAKLAILTNPNNPTGTVMSQNELVKLIEAAEENDVLMMVDEAYYWIYDKTVTGLIDKFRNLVILRTFSKILGIAGLRLGMAISNKDLILDLKKVAPSAGVNVLALLFGEKIIDNQMLISKLISDFRREKEYLISRLEQNYIPYIATDSNYVLIKVDDKNIQEVLAEFKDKGILVSFKMNKYLRVNVGHEEYMDAFVKAYKEIFEQVK